MIIATFWPKTLIRPLHSALVLLLVSICPVFAQQAEISGFVTDPSGSVVTDAKVSLQHVATNILRATSTNAAGLFIFPSIPAGTYQLSVEAPGFETHTVEDIVIESGARITRNLSLSLGQTSDTVTVSGSGINLNTVNAAVSTLVDRQFVENIPLNGRSLNSLLTLVPGVSVVASSGTSQSGSISVNGQRTEANYFTVDGISANTGVPLEGTVGFGAGFSGSTPGETAIGTTQSMVSIEALQEFRATTSTFSAEYGRSPGGHFAFTTRSGTNDPHGSLYNYFRNDALDANNWFSNATATPKPATRQNDFGGTFGGPVFLPKFYDGRNRTFFFFSYEGLRLRSPQAGVVTHVPSASMRQQAPAELQPILNAFPMPNGEDLGNGLATFTSGYSIPSNINTTALRLDHSFSDNFKVFGRFNYAPSNTVTRHPGNLAQTVDKQNSLRTFTLGSTNLFTPHLVNEARFGITDNNGTLTYRFTNFEGAIPMRITDNPGYTDDPYTRLAFQLNWGLRPNVYVLPQDATQRQYNFTDTLHWTLGRHALKFGMDYRSTGNRTYFPKLYNIPVYTSMAQVLANSPSAHTQVGYTNVVMRPIYRNFSAFVQDDWRATSRLNLSLGLRWEVNPAPVDAENYPLYTIDQAYDLTTTKLAPLGTDQWKTTYNNFAPRVGIAYQASQKSGFETVLRSGFGVFFDTGNTQATDGYGRIGSRGQIARPGTPWPLTPELIGSLPAPSIDPPYAQALITDDPNLKLPYTLHWNAAVEQGLGSQQTLTVSYVGAGGRRLLATRTYNPRLLGNPNFGNAGLILTTNQGFSSYNALQAQFQRRLSKGLQVLASYTWAHAIDNATSNFTINQLLRASSDYDIRHNFQAAITYLAPREYDSAFARAVLGGWAIDGRLFARSSLPVDVIGATAVNPITAVTMDYHPNLVPNQPLYLDDASAPGGRRINFNAFEAVASGVEGNAGRNVARGFDAVQTDIAVRRDFRLTEGLNLQLRAESFNIFNRPNFGAIRSNLTSEAALFGVATNTLNTGLGGLNPLYQVGGPRSMQLALKLSF